MQVRLPRSKRLVAITYDLIRNPHKVIPFSRFGEISGSAKSTISEDITLIKETFSELGLGKVDTVAGAGGGVEFTPSLTAEKIQEIVNRLCQEVGDPRRILSGGFIYMADVLFSPDIAGDAALVFATEFADAKPDVILTVETKGIPLAFMTAMTLGVPLAIARRNSAVTEGPVVTINYVSGSTRQIQSMSLARRALWEGARVLIVDDFMKGGGTARGLIDLCLEFGARVVGTGVLIATSEPPVKLVEDYLALLVLEGVDEGQRVVRVRPGEFLTTAGQRNGRP